MAEPTFLKIGISTWVSILATCATFSLVLVTLWTLRHIKKQTVFMHKQALLAAKEQSPILQVENFRIKGNSLIFKIKNSGKGHAHQIGVHSNFKNAKPIVESYDKEKEVYLGRVGYDPYVQLIDVFEDEKRVVVEDNKGCLNYISKSKKKVVILGPGETENVEMEPEFWLQFPYRLRQTFGRLIKFVDLIDLLNKNGRQFVGFSFELVCKNGVDDIQDSIPLAKFGFDIKNHKTLEDAKNQGYSLGFLPLSGNDVEMFGAISYEIYNNTKSTKNHVPGEAYGDAEDTFTKMK